MSLQFAHAGRSAGLIRLLRPGRGSQASARTPDHPRAKRNRERTFVPLQAMIASRACQAVSLGLVQRAGEPAITGLADLAAD